MFRLTGQLYRANFISPTGFFRLLSSFLLCGRNLMTILRFSSKVNPQKIAVNDNAGDLNFRELYKKTRQLAGSLQKDYNIRDSSKVAILCRNHCPLVKSLIALSYLGAEVHLFNTGMSDEDKKTLLDKDEYDLIIYDIEFWEVIENSFTDKPSVLSAHLTFESIDSLSDRTNNKRTKRGTNGRIYFIKNKNESFKKSYSFFLKPLFALLKHLELAKYPNAFIGTPICHHTGMTVFVNMLILGKKIALTKNIDAEITKTTLLKQKIQIAFLTPSVLNKITKNGTLELIYLKSIISVGSALNRRLVEETISCTGNKLANLYGNSDIGYSLLATPEDLKKHPETSGKSISGFRHKITDSNKRELETGEKGALWAETKKEWKPTGDIAYKDEDGYIFLCGKKEDLIIINNKKIYTSEMEEILLNHPKINQAVVIGIPDEGSGQCMKAFISIKKNAYLSQEMLQGWLEENAEGKDIPAIYEFLEGIPVDGLGRIDKQALQQLIFNSNL